MENQAQSFDTNFYCGQGKYILFKMLWLLKLLNAIFKVKSTFPVVKEICDRFSDYIERKSNIGHVFEAKIVS